MTRQRFLIFMLVCTVSCISWADPNDPVVIQRVWYVDDDAPGQIHDGSSWETAFVHLQDALAVVQADEMIRVAQGTYRPDQGNGMTPGDREATFQLISGVTLTGGYAGPGVLDANDIPIDPNTRNINLFKTILSGDLNGDDREDGGLDDSSTDPNRAENCYHVVTGSGTNADAVLDGFVVTGGTADKGEVPGYDNDGGGVLIRRGSPTFRNCRFSRNMANQGGAVWNRDASPVFMNCLFMDNEAVEMTLTSSIRSDPYTVTSAGGAVDSDFSSHPVFINCAFWANRAVHGGAIGVWEQSSVDLHNCTLSGNRADFGGALYNYSTGTTTITNSILWGNEAATRDEILTGSKYPSTTIVSYSCIAGGHAGTGNTSANPRFVSGPLGDYYLSQIGAGQWWDSPCVDAGNDTASNLGLGERTTRTDEVGDQGTVDMGYHYPQWVSSGLEYDQSAEGFESGHLDSLPWEVSGDAYWIVCSGERNSGRYSAQAGLIGDNQSSVLKITLDCVDGEISFYYKVSSEAYFDHLKFYIDGMEKDNWSGERDWTQVFFPVTAGTRAFRWEYVKDRSVSVGTDSAWIDDIVFPMN